MTDENTLIVPDDWWRARHPRRDRPDVPEPSEPRPDYADHARSLIADAHDKIEEILGLPGTEPDIAEAGSAHLRGDANPRGAAAVAAVAVPLHGLGAGDVPGHKITAAWVTDHGVAFAAAAFAELSGIVTDRDSVFVPADRAAGAPSRHEQVWTGVRHGLPDRRWGDLWWLYKGVARWLRTHLAAAPGDVYAEAVEGLADRRGNTLQKLVAAYLAPTRDDWVDDLCTDSGWSRTRPPAERWLAFCALGRPHQPAALGLPLLGNDQGIDVVASLIDGVGPEAVVPLLADAVDGDASRPVHTLLDVLGTLPLDEAFQALAARSTGTAAPPALLAAARRFPARAMRLLAEARTPRAADLLPVHVRTHPDLAETVLPTLPAESRKAVRGILDATTRLPDAADLPPLLTEPPWTRPRTAATPVVLKGLAASGVRAVAWEPGEREAWAAREPAHWRRSVERVDFDDVAKRFAAGKCDHRLQGLFLVKGPEEAVLPLLAGWEPEYTTGIGRWLAPLVARFETAAHDAVLSVARRNPAALAECLLPLVGHEIARTMAGWLGTKRVRGTARAWLDRHGPAAAPSLVPDALGKAGPPRRAAEQALRRIADRHGRAPVVDAARAHGDKAAAAIEALLGIDPLDDLPQEIPSVDWVDMRALPRLVLRDRTHALPDDAARHVLTMLALSKPGEPYAGVQTVIDLCDPASLAGFGWALFRWWELCGAPADDGWALTQLALTGDDDTARRLAPVIRAWPGESNHARAATGLDILAAIGTDTALMHLNSISQRVKYKGLKTKAQEKIEEVAADLELTPEQLADRLVPDFGLDASGTLVLDYGPRRFTVGFDEHLNPTIADEDGKRRKSLPKPGANDDPDLAPAARKRFAALKKDVRTVAADQLARLERAMVAQRRLPLAEFRELFVAHPLTGRLVRRLVWRTDETAFRVAEDGTFANVHDDTVTLPENAHVAIAHPLHLGDEATAWSQVFADYEILQPFPQLGRPVHTLTDGERTSGRLARFENLEVPTGDVLGLVRRGWERGAPQDAGIEPWISRRLAPNRYLVVTLDPGIAVGQPDLLGDHTLTDVRLAARPDDYAHAEDTSPRFGDLDPVTASEALADLIHLTSPTPETDR